MPRGAPAPKFTDVVRSAPSGRAWLPSLLAAGWNWAARAACNARGVGASPAHAGE
jgi:hypothetical protein